jgi:hypothetical protein
MSNPYPAEFRERALRMLAEARGDHASDFAAANHVAGRLGWRACGRCVRRTGLRPQCLTSLEVAGTEDHPYWWCPWCKVARLS